ncbi:MAG: sigma-70 family RNA polymerase sigma factor [Rubrivivax sp.]|nr:sigma-70 family RNA polymerase sigma factor [Rubrivivax sp.]
MSEAPREVTRLLGAWRAGDEQALAELTPLVYRELHRLARGAMRGERPGHTLQATALVHEAFIELSDARVDWVDRAHFYAIAARQMRRILVNHAEAHRAAKRGGGQPHAPLTEALDVVGTPSAEITDLDDALRRLEAFDARKAQALELHYFGGLTYDEIAAVLQVSPSTVDTELRFAKAWLRTRLEPDVDVP